MEKLIIKSEKEINECINAQNEYWKRTGDPDFAPHNGVCWCCHKQIYQNIGYKKDQYRDIECNTDGEMVDYVSGISLEKAKNKLVTGCPHCNRSYCE